MIIPLRLSFLTQFKKKDVKLMGSQSAFINNSIDEKTRTLELARIEVLKEMRHFTGEESAEEFFCILPNNRWKTAWDILIIW